MDIRLDTGFFRHAKTLKLLRRLGSDAVLALQELWAYAREFHPSGDLEDMDTEAIELAAGWPQERMPGQLVAALVELRWLDVAVVTDSSEEGSSWRQVFSLHNWAERQPWAAGAEKRSDDAKKAVTKRWDGVRALKAETAPGADPIRKPYDTDTPSPSPSPSVSPDGDTRNGLPSEALSAGADLTTPEARKRISQVAREDGQLAAAIVNLYNHTALRVGLPQVVKPGPKLIGQIRQRLIQDPDRRRIEWWDAYLVKVAQSDFLCGRTEGMERPFRADLLWLTGVSNMEKVLLGRYDNRAANGRKLSAVGNANAATIREAQGLGQIGPGGTAVGRLADSTVTAAKMPPISPRILSDGGEDE